MSEHKKKNTSTQSFAAFKVFYHFLFLLIFSACAVSFTANAQRSDSTGKRSIVIPDTLLFKIEQAQAVITQINTANTKGYNSGNIRRELKTIKGNAGHIQRALADTEAIPNNKDLLNYRIMLTDVQQKTTQWRKLLSRHNAELQQMSEQIIEFGRDSLLAVNNRDTTQKKLYSGQIYDLRQRLQQAGKITTANLDTVSNLLADVSEVYFLANDLQSTISGYLKESGRNLFGRETSYIWKPSVRDNQEKVRNMISVSYLGQNNILRYFFQSTWDNRILLVLLCIGFFVWVYYNYSKAAGAKLSREIGKLEFNYINARPLLATFIVLLNLTPLFEPRAPSIYIELNQFLLLMTLTVFFLKMLPPNHLMWWFSVLILYVLVIFSNVIVDASFFLRFLLIGLNVGSILFGIRFYKKLKEVKLEERFIKPILIIYVFLNSSAILLNALGRVTLAKTLNITAISGLIQILSLGVFVHVLTEAVELQIKVSSCSNGIFSRINVQKTRASFQKAMTVISVVLWLLVFFINLNIIDPVFGFLFGIMEKPRNFGSITFTLQNVLIFSLILWISNNLQKNISLFFSGPEVSFTEESVHKGSKLALIRLVIIVIGFLFAVTASGVPLDKITVLLGALGVGNGLGMQNIVNNFVSGIILIFEKPFTIGDYIELADKKGKVMDIGIRSSRMLTPQGSSVIIPNGDLLSGRLVNYTTSNARLKSEVVFKINIDSDLEAAKKIINDIVDDAEGIVKKAPRQILFSAIAADNVELKITVWLNDVYSETAFKSYVLEQILIRFRKSEIKVM
ncbi:mechanosensitive ion channel family protein [Dyadobacter sediminis]|uniref:Mechanosensitive ion channel n=1 Tax=Dyadobacter sediminis TaxID=1493691 RepID=A0A5R9KFF9_9BACT|nr:mechanosensitive ion channel domain-containing protein [Dyadobacter sediminis]TLU94845.1 mechanosensitive ion channel [Dyadobacter sediminis]GGB87482.1 hypothetical protein GCM10011325_13820 [Dyadobacter sediminis]